MSDSVGCVGCFKGWRRSRAHGGYFHWKPKGTTERMVECTNTTPLVDTEAAGKVDSALAAAYKELWATYGDTARLHSLYSQIEEARRLLVTHTLRPNGRT